VLRWRIFAIQMRSIYLKEINSFFSSIVGYVVIVVFLLASGLFMWVLPATNLLDYGFVSLEKFFDFAPWLLAFLIPAITMRMFPDEFKSGTIELLLTRPLKENHIILGKYLAAITLVIIALLPTLLYVFSITRLANRGHSLDAGGIIGSYIGLLFLSAAFTAIGIFFSALTTNQIVSFLFALFGCYIFYAGFEALSGLPVFSEGLDYVFSLIGLQYHYKSISRGVMDTRDIVYFVSVIALFLLGTNFILQRRNLKN
jgi:ABC-2 type transport system permease protein